MNVLWVPWAFDCSHDENLLYSGPIVVFFLSQQSANATVDFLFERFHRCVRAGGPNIFFQDWYRYRVDRAFHFAGDRVVVFWAEPLVSCFRVATQSYVSYEFFKLFRDHGMASFFPISACPHALILHASLVDQ
jgi:hypothetical protein